MIKIRSVIITILCLFSVLVSAESLSITIKKSTYVLPEPTDSQELIYYQSLSAAESLQFLEKRKDFLKKAAVSLRALKWGFGVGIVVKNYFQYKLEKNHTADVLKSTYNFTDGVGEDMRVGIEKEVVASEEKWQAIKNKTFSETADEVITNILSSLDKQLWQQAKVVAHANEFGAVMAVGIVAEGGIKDKKGWGGLTDIGISIGYNKDQESVAIQIFHNLESYKSTQMPVIFIAGAVGKMGIYFSNQDKDLTAKGTSFYPPMVPGFSSTTDRSFMVGGSSGLTWPPSPIGDILTYSNKLTQTGLIRISVSKLTKGFIRIQTASLKNIMKATYESTKSVMQSLRNKPGANACYGIFN